MVEEVLDHNADDTVPRYYDSRLPTFGSRLQLSKSIRLVDRHARCDVLLLVQRILQTTVYQTIETTGKDRFFIFIFHFLLHSLQRPRTISPRGGGGEL